MVKVATAPAPSALERLVAAEAIRNLKARYFRALDTRNWSDLPGLFAADAVFDLRWVNSMQDRTTGEWIPPLGTEAQIFRGRDVIAAMIRAAIENLHTVHRAFVPEIEILTPQTARAIWPMEDVLRQASGELLLSGFGHYHETYVNDEGGWLIATSRLTRVYMTGGALALDR